METITPRVWCVRTAQAMVIYDDARTIAEAKEAAEMRLAELGASAFELPDVSTIRATIAQAFDRLGEVIAGGTIEERRELAAAYI